MNEIKDKQSITHICREYYKDLYKLEPTNKNNQLLLLKNHHRIIKKNKCLVSDDDNISLNKLIDESEVIDSLNSFIK